MPRQLSFCGEFADEQRALFDAAVDRLGRLGGVRVDVDYGPFLEANDLLFEGPWVAERYASVGDFVEAAADGVVFPVTRDVILGAKAISAVTAFRGIYAQETLKRKVRALFDDVDCLVTPTTPAICRVADVDADPLKLNASLGYYTNSTNLLDLSAIAVPNGFLSHNSGLPTGVTFVAPPFSEVYLTALGAAFHRCRPPLSGSSEDDEATTTRLGATSFTLS